MKYFNIILSVSIIVITLISIAVLAQRRAQYKEYFESDCTGPFPRRIFQTWKSHTEFPENFAYWSNTWKSLNPTYTYELFDDADNRAFVERTFPWFLKRFDAYDKPIKKADVVRYLYLYAHGGIYADMDFECLKSFDSLLDTHKDAGVLLGCMADYENEADSPANNVPNAIMVSKPRNPFWLCMAHVLMNRHGGRADEETGPNALRDAYLLYTSGDYKTAEWYSKILGDLPETLKPCENGPVKIVKSVVLYPIPWGRDDLRSLNDEMLHSKDRQASSDKMRKLYPESYASTYWTHSWKDQ